MLAFDATYITATVAQAELNDKIGLVGGVYKAEDPFNAFASLQEGQPVDSSRIEKSGSMCEFMCWDPSSAQKAPLSLLSLPIEVNFGGRGAGLRGNYYMCSLLGAFMKHSNKLIKAVVCDNASTHQVIRRALHGQFSADEEANLLEIEWFKDLVYSDPPAHCLPRFPIRVCRSGENVIYGIPGVCRWL